MKFMMILRKVNRVKAIKAVCDSYKKGIEIIQGESGSQSKSGGAGALYWLATDEKITFAVYFVIDGAETLYREITLKEGWNYFTIYDFYSYATDGLTQIRFRSENFYEEDANGNAKEKVFYLDTLSIVKR